MSSGGGKNPELTVCQVHTATSALVRSLWMTGQVRVAYLVRAAAVITLTQDRLARSRRSHAKTKRRRLRELGIKLSVLRCCILEA